MKDIKDYDALLQNIMMSLTAEDPNKNPYFKWLEDNRNSGVDLTFANFVRESINSFYKS